jgi:hypothetical protein
MNLDKWPITIALTKGKLVGDSELGVEFKAIHTRLIKWKNK